MDMQIEKPIFIIGCGRSGTTIFYNLLAGHGSLGWFSSYMVRYPKLPYLARLNNLYQVPFLVNKYKKKKWFPKPVEAFSFWDLFHHCENPSASPPLTELDVADADTQTMHKYISDTLHFSNRKRFVNKNTRNTRRMRYLHAIFPDALFIHVIRDGRACVNSFMNVDWWSTLSLWIADGKTPAELEQEGLNSAVIAARLWKLEVERVLHDKEYIPADQYIEIRYENLTKHPYEEMKRILEYCRLPWNEHFQSHIEAFRIQSRNFKWIDNLQSQQITSVNKEIGFLLTKLGYTT